MFKRIAVALLCFAMVGCGPSAQEQYETALSIFEKERNELRLIDAQHNVKEAHAYDNVRREFFGDSNPDVVMRQLNELDSLEGLVSKEVILERKTELLDELKASNKRLEEFRLQLEDPDSELNQRLSKAYASLPTAKKLEEQQERFDRAKKMLSEAEARLN